MSGGHKARCCSLINKFGWSYLVINLNPDLEINKSSITKARNDERTKKSQKKFRDFQLSCFRDKCAFSSNAKLTANKVLR